MHVRYQIEYWPIRQLCRFLVSEMINVTLFKEIPNVYIQYIFNVEDFIILFTLYVKFDVYI